MGVKPDFLLSGNKKSLRTSNYGRHTTVSYFSWREYLNIWNFSLTSQNISVTH